MKKVSKKDVEGAKFLIDKQLEAAQVRQASRKASQSKQADASQFTFTLPMHYQPEFASLERIMWPIDRAQQNRYWRLFYKCDPVISTIVDLFGDIISSDFTITGEGVDGEIKDTFEDMINETKIISSFPHFIREFLVMGEVIPHLIFDKNKNYWSGLLFHNPDQIKVIDSPFVGMEPIVEYTPDSALRALVKSQHPAVQQAIAHLPAEVIQSIQSGKNIVLDTNLNVSFIARKVHPYDVRGTSILTRLYRILVFEDAVANATIATARRHAGPLKIAKLGDKELGWVPNKEYEQKIIELLTMAEQDPHAFLVLPWFVQFEAFGTTDRVINIRQEWDVIERIKLTALGVSQGFLHGECCIFATPILTADYTYKPIQDIKVGEQVIDKEGKKRTVTHAWQSNTPNTLTQIELWGGKTITCTDSHKFPVWAWQRECACGCGQSIKSGEMYKQGHYARIKEVDLIKVDAISESSRSRFKGVLKNYNSYKTLEASQIHKYDCLMIPRKFEESNVKNLTLDHAKLLGFYVAEGCYLKALNVETHSDSIQWTFNINEKETYAKEVMEAGKNLGMEFFLNERKNTCNVRTAKKGYVKFYQWLLTNGGRYSHLFQLSPEVMGWPLPLKEELIRAMFKGDGSRSNLKKLDKRVNKEYNSYVVQYGTVSKILADQIQIILAQLGIYTVIDKVKKHKKENGYNCRDAYNIKCYSHHAQKLAKLVWDEDVVIQGQIRSKFWFDENYMYIPVKSVKTIKNVDKIPVYNLTVDGDHSYLAEGFGTFNSTYASMKGNMQTLLMKLRGMRTFFEQVWWYSKFFEPIAKMNKFIKRPKSQVDHRFRVTGEKEQYIIPKIQWSRGLDPKVDSELLDAFEQLVTRLDLPISKSTAYSAAGLDHEEEFTNIIQEKKTEEEIAKKMGSPIETVEKEEEEAEPEVGGEEEVLPETEVPGASKQSIRQPVKKLAFGKDEIEDLVEILSGNIVAETDLWNDMIVDTDKRREKNKGKNKGNGKNVKGYDWDDAYSFLDSNGYAYEEINELRKAMVDKGVLEASAKDIMEREASKIYVDMSDKDIDNAIKKVIKAKVKDKKESFFVGEGNKDKL